MLDSASRTAAPEGMSRLTTLVMTALVALGAGVAAQQVLQRGWRGVWSRTVPERTVPEPTVSSGTLAADGTPGGSDLVMDDVARKAQPAPRPRGTGASPTPRAPAPRR